MVMKLIQLEVSLEGLGNRNRVFNKIESILKQDWGTLADRKEKQAQLQKRHEKDLHQDEISSIEKELQNIQRKLMKTEHSFVGTN